MAAKLPTAKSAAVNSAAKDDVVGHDGDFTFSINDLLANDPGGANKNGNFFFGSAADQDSQARYLADHHIVKISDADGGTYQLEHGATDFDYMVQIGGNGTWSTAHVKVEASPDLPPPPTPTGHLGAEIAKWDFEGTTATYNSDQAVSAPNGWYNVSDYAETNNLGTYAKSMEMVKDDASHLISNFGAGESQWLDTAASPGNIWIQLSEANRTTNITHDAKLTVSVAKQMFGDGSGGSNGGANSHTDPNASVDFYFNYEKVGTVKASDITHNNEFQDFTFTVHANDSMATDQLFIQSHGTDASAQGLAIDHIVLHDWII